jgi:nucleoside-diphosphate-sugar epimerase
MSKYVVTGGAGFIGSNIAEALLARGHEVTVIDDLSTGREANLQTLEGPVTFVRADVRDRVAVEKALAGAQALFHQAAIPSVVRSFEDPAESLSVNIAGTAAVLEACRAAAVGRVVFASSSSVYGDSPTLPKEESMEPVPKSPYALSKLTCENLLRIYSETYGMETVSLRYFNVFGPRQDPASEYAAVIPKFITAVLRGQQPVIYGDGKQTRDFAYIDNVVEANLRCLEARGLAGQAVNVACGDRIDLLELLAMINELAGRELRPSFEAERPGDVRHSLASIERARALLGYGVKTPVRLGLSLTMDYFKELINNG